MFALILAAQLSAAPIAPPASTPTWSFELIAPGLPVTQKIVTALRGSAAPLVALLGARIESISCNFAEPNPQCTLRLSAWTSDPAKIPAGAENVKIKQ